MINKKERLYDNNGFSLNWVAPFSQDRELLQSRIDFFRNTSNKTMTYITSEYEDFIKKFEESLAAHKYINIKGLERFEQKDVIIGCQHFIDQLIMTHGLCNLQVLKGGYTYYEKLDANFKYAQVDQLVADKPLILEYPFPSEGDRHPKFEDIINRATEIGMDVYLDCAWLPVGWELDLDLGAECIKGLAISLSKPYGLHWSRVGVRWTKSKVHDTISIENKYRMVSYPNVMVGKYYLDRFPMDYLVSKYKNDYTRMCQTHGLESRKTIMSAYSKTEGCMVGLANALVKKDV
jgi:hypothetical protein